MAAEDRALSDSELAVELAPAGFPVARRTIAKYREQLGIHAQPLR
ncbi:MAG: RNA polymerase factor sigma-54 [Solirubrobacteraceae bacterium]